VPVPVSRSRSLGLVRRKRWSRGRIPQRKNGRHVAVLDLASSFGSMCYAGTMEEGGTYKSEVFVLV